MAITVFWDCYIYLDSWGTYTKNGSYAEVITTAN